MVNPAVLVLVIYTAVDWMLLMGANILRGRTVYTWRCLLAAVIGGALGSLCLFAGLNEKWSAVFQVGCVLVTVIGAFGLSVEAVQCGMVFVLLRIIVKGIAMGFPRGGLLLSPTAILAALILLLMKMFGKIGAGSFVPVELTYGDRKMCFTALRDTGNHLRDPLTGKPVLVLGADAAEALTGLSAQQLRTPIETMGKIPGLRLLPYKSVGTESGLLLALRLRNVKIGSQSATTVVAFSPVVLNEAGKYQALTGGHG